MPGPGVPLPTPRPAAGGFPGAYPGSAAGMPHAAAMPPRPSGLQPAAGMPGYAGQVSRLFGAAFRQRFTHVNHKYAVGQVIRGVCNGTVGRGQTQQPYEEGFVCSTVLA